MSILLHCVIYLIHWLTHDASRIYSLNVLSLFAQWGACQDTAHCMLHSYNDACDKCRILNPESKTTQGTVQSSASAACLLGECGWSRDSRLCHKNTHKSDMYNLSFKIPRNDIFLHLTHFGGWKSVEFDTGKQTTVQHILTVMYFESL